MKALFDRIEINGLKLKNHFVRSATWEGLAGLHGSCTDEITNIMTELAKGQIGLLITSHSYVNPSGQASFRQLGIYDDSLISSYCKMVKEVHQNNSKILLQLAHGGCRSARNITHLPVLGPSPCKNENNNEYCEEMSEKQIRQSVEDFTSAALRARRIGFDGIQIHAAHGYLLSQFLSPYFNHRKDKYGGNIKNRARFILEIIHAIRKELGAGFFISVKLNSEDYIENGFSIEDMIQTSILFEKEGIDAVELSGGIAIKAAKYPPYRPRSVSPSYIDAYYEKAAGLFKQNVKIPLILVGGIRAFQSANTLVQERKADLISMSRPLIREPHLIKRWYEGDRRNALCISCNRCLDSARKGKGIYCVSDKEMGEAKF